MDNIRCNSGADDVDAIRCAKINTNRRYLFLFGRTGEHNTTSIQCCLSTHSHAHTFFFSFVSSSIDTYVPTIGNARRKREEKRRGEKENNRAFCWHVFKQLEVFIMHRKKREKDLDMDSHVLQTTRSQ